MLITAAPIDGARVRKPDGQILKPEGEVVELDSFWLRRQADGDVTLDGEVPEPPQPPDPPGPTAGAVRYDVAQQLSAPQKSQAADNIGALKAASNVVQILNSSFAFAVRPDGSGFQLLFVDEQQQQHELMSYAIYRDQNNNIIGTQVEAASENHSFCLNHREVEGWAGENIPVNIKRADGSAFADAVAYLQNIANHDNNDDSHPALLEILGGIQDVLQNLNDRLEVVEGNQPAEIPNFVYRSTPTWKTAAARIKAGTGRGRIVCIGSSSTSGIGAGSGGANNSIGARLYSYPHLLAPALTELGIPASEESVFGDSNIPTAHAITYPQYDPRVTFPTPGFTYPGSIYISAGCNFRRVTGAGNAGAADAFSPLTGFDRFTLFGIRNTNQSPLTVQVDGETVGTFDTDSGDLALYSQTFSCELGIHTIKLIRPNENTTSGWIGIIAWDSSVPAVDIVQASASGTTISFHDDNTQLWYPRQMLTIKLAADLVIIQSVNNDANNATATANYHDTVTALAQHFINAGVDVLLMTSLPPNDSRISNTLMCNAALAQVAEELQLPFFDLFTWLGGSWAAANESYGMTDSLHGSAALYQAEAGIVAQVLQALAA
jgi:hypothetical protein